MAKQETIILNPLTLITVRSDGMIIFRMKGETGENVTLEFDNITSLEQHAAVFLKGAETREEYEDFGFEEAKDFLEDHRETEDDIENANWHELLNEPGTDE